MYQFMTTADISRARNSTITHWWEINCVITVTYSIASPCVSSWQQLISPVPGIALSPHWCEINCVITVTYTTASPCISSWQQLISPGPGIALSPHWSDINCVITMTYSTASPCVSSWQQLISPAPGIALSPHWCEINCSLCVSSCPWMLQMTDYCWTLPLCFINCNTKDSGSYIDGSVQQRHNSSALAMELSLTCNNPLMWWVLLSVNSNHIYHYILSLHACMQ